MKFWNQYEVESAARATHACPNVRKGVKLLLKLMESVNEQSDGWAYWNAPIKASEKLMTLLETAGNMDGLAVRPLSYGTRGTITAEALKKAIAPIRAMVTRQKKLQAERGNSFNFDVDAALQD